MSICTGNPTNCPGCNGPVCPIDHAHAQGQVTPMNEAARQAMRAKGESFDEDASVNLERLFGDLQ